MTANRNKHPQSDIVVFLGSGASQFAGYRTFQSFDTLLFDSQVRINDNLPPVRGSTIQLMTEIKSSLEQQHKAVTHDNYLWMLEKYKNFCDAFSRGDSLKSRLQSQSRELWGTLGPFGQEVDDAIADVVATTLHHYSQNRVQVAKTGDHRTFSNLQQVARLYAQLAEVNNPQFPYLPIFTTNYDMLIEDMFADEELRSVLEGLRLINGISGLTAEQAPWRPQEYEAAAGTGLHLYRVHGCVCWLYHVYGQEDVYHHRDDLLQQDLQKLCVMIPGREIFRGKMPHALAFRALYDHLRHCRIAIFIGFSFRDDDVMHLLLAANAARTRERIRLIVINPIMNPDKVRASFEGASTRSPFPVLIPNSNEICHLPTRFGWEDGFGKRIIDCLQGAAHASSTSV